MIFPVEVKDFRKYGRDRNLRVTGSREKSCRDGGFEEPFHVIVSPRMNTIASHDQFRPIRIGENWVVNYIKTLSTRLPKIPVWNVVYQLTVSGKKHSPDRFSVTSSFSKTIRHKRRHICFCLQFFCLFVCFVWKPMHFEFQIYGVSWHSAKIAFIENIYLIISWFMTFLEVKTLGKVLM